MLFTFVVLSPSGIKVRTKNEAVLMCEQDGNLSPETAPMLGTPETSNLLDVTEGQKSSRLMWFLCFASTFVQSDGCAFFILSLCLVLFLNPRLVVCKTRFYLLFPCSIGIAILTVSLKKSIKKECALVAIT